MLPVSLDCPFLIASQVFSNLYFVLFLVPNVARVSRLSNLDYTFGFL